MAHTISHGTNTWQSESSGNDNCTRDITTHAFSMPKRQILFLSSVLRGNIHIPNHCKFELQSPDNDNCEQVAIYRFLLSRFMVIFSNVLKRWF